MAMTVSELEATYQQLHEQMLRGELAEEEFKSEVEQLRFKDDLGTQWKIGWYTGKWYRYDDGQWIQDKPPTQQAPVVPPAAAGAPPPATPATSPSSSSAASTRSEPDRGQGEEMWEGCWQS